MSMNEENQAPAEDQEAVAVVEEQESAPADDGADDGDDAPAEAEDAVEE